MTAWRIEAAPVPGLSSVYTCEDPSSPSQSLYMGMGMVMMPKKGCREMVRWAGSMGRMSATKSVAVAVPLVLWEIGKETCTSCIQLQSLAHHAHRILVQPVQETRR